MLQLSAAPQERDARVARLAHLLGESVAVHGGERKEGAAVAQVARTRKELLCGGVLPVGESQFGVVEELKGRVGHKARVEWVH
jgi:hypothetical protein